MPERIPRYCELSSLKRSPDIRSSWEASTIRSRPARLARCDTADALIPSAIANSFLGRPSRSPPGSAPTVHRVSREDGPDISGRFAAALGALICAALRKAVQTCAKPGWSWADAVHSMASRAAHQPGPSWMPEVVSRIVTSPAMQSDIHRRSRQPDRQCRVDGGADAVNALEFVAYRECGRIGDQSKCGGEFAVQLAAVGK